MNADTGGPYRADGQWVRHDTGGLVLHCASAHEAVIEAEAWNDADETACELEEWERRAVALEHHKRVPAEAIADTRARAAA